MSRDWGRESYAGDWPSRKPTGILLALVIAGAGRQCHLRPGSPKGGLGLP